MGTMTLAANKSNGEGHAKAPAGNHPARLVAIIDLGTQENNYQGEIKKQHQAYFVWELVLEQEPGTTRNFTLAIDLNLSLNEKAKLRKWIEARSGRLIPDGSQYAIEDELGQPCLLSVALSGSGYPKITGVSAVPRGMTVPDPTYKPFFYTLDDYRNGNHAVPPFVPYYFGRPILEVIKKAQELKGAAPVATAAGNRTPPPRRRSSVVQYWVDPGEDGRDTLPHALVEAQILDLVQSRKLDPARAFVQDAANPAADWVSMAAALPATLAAPAF